MNEQDIEAIAEEVAYQGVLIHTKNFWIGEEEQESLYGSIKILVRKNLEPFRVPE